MGIRTGKTIFCSTSETVFDYVLDGSKIIKETQSGAQSLTLYYYYDDSGVTGFEYNGTSYYYGKNLQGDIVRIYDSAGQIVVTYTYDAWGNILSITGSLASTIGNINPFRYRSYYYDTETGFYYLNSRYYDPSVGRFINADGMVKTPGISLLSSNMYSYCENNPVNRSDSTGKWFGLDDLIAGAVGFVVGVGSQFVSDVVTSACSGSLQFSSWQTYVGSGVGGAIGGVSSLYVGPVAASAIGSGSSTFIGQTLENITGGEERSMGEIIANSLSDALISAVVIEVIPVKIFNITTGRNNMESIYKSGLTRLKNKTASGMSSNVFFKGIKAGLTSDFNINISQGVNSFFDNVREQYMYTR